MKELRKVGDNIIANERDFPIKSFIMMRIENRISFETQNLLFRILLVSLALVIGFLYGFQHLLWLHDIHWDYQHAIFIPSFRTPDADHYLAQLQEIYEGHYWLSNTYLAEYKHVKKSLWPVLPYYLTALIGKLLHLKVQYLAVLMDFTLPSLTFLLAYFFLSTISPGRRISLLGAFGLTLIPHILWLESLLSVGLRLLVMAPPIFADAHCYHCFSRPINPQLTYPFLLATLLFFFKGIKTLKHRYFFLAVLFGTMISYSYVYFSSYLYVFLGLMVIGFFVLKEQLYFQRSLIVLSSILIFSVPFWYSIFRSSDTTLSQMARMVRSHTPIIDTQSLLTLLICACIAGCLFKRLVGNLTGLTSLSLLLSGVICLNQHVITGINTQPQWHYNMFIIPQSAILAVVLLAAEFMKKRNPPNLSHSRRILFFSKASLVFYGGIGFTSLSMLLRPSYVASHLSSDGILSPEFTSVLKMLQLSGFGIGLGFVTLGILLKTRPHRFFDKWGLLILQVLQKIRRFMRLYIPIGTILYILATMSIIWDISLAQFNYYQNYVRPLFRDLQDLSQALDWLNTQTEKESVILSGLEAASVIPIYTHNNVYIAPHAQFYTVPSLPELQDRLYNLMYFSGITSQKDFDQFINSSHDFMKNFNASFEAYQKKFKRDVYVELKQYRVDYLVYGPREQKSFKLHPEERYSFLKKIYDDGIVKIYQIL